MPAGIFNDFILEQGATFIAKIWYKNAAGSAFDLTNYDARMMIRVCYDSPPLLSLTLGNGITLGGAAGSIDLFATATQTDAINLNQDCVYDLEIENSMGVVTRILQGNIFVSREVTR